MNTTSDSEQAGRTAAPTSDTHLGTAGVGGAIGGAIAGAALGTVVGPVGTAIGATIGAIAGGFVGKVVEGTHTTAAQDQQPAASAVAPDHETVAMRAYYIWEERGRSDGHALDDWLQAESALQQR